MAIKDKKRITLAQRKKKLQTLVNAYIRQRDSRDGFFTCIACCKTLPVSKCQAGHYIPVSKSQFLRFNELNIHAECQGCNCFDESHLIFYRRNLVKKIGLEAVESLERSAETIKLYKHTQQELDEIEAYYNQLLAIQ